MREAGKGRVPWRWGFSKGEKRKKLDEIRQHRLIYFTIEKGLKWPGKSRKKGGGNCKYKANAAERWTLFGFCDWGFSIRPLFPLLLMRLRLPLSGFFCDELDNEKEKKQSL